MEAKTQYTDFIGTAAADISDHLGISSVDNLESIAKSFDVDTKRFKCVGISIYGTDSFYISLLCVDNDRSTTGNEYIVKMSIEVEDENTILDLIFKRLHIVLHSQYDEKYKELDFDEESNYESFHDSDRE